MGILHSSNRYFGCKTQDEDEDEFGRPIYSYLDSPKTSSACSSIVNAILQGIRFLFGLVWRRKAANPVLPIQNSISSSREPLLAQTRNSDDERRSQLGIVNDLYYQQWLEEKKQRNVPAVLEKKMGMKSADLARLIKGSSSSSSSSIDVVSNEKMGMKSADPARLIKSSSSSIDHVVSNEKIRKLLSLQTTDSNSGRSPQWLGKKLVTSSSTLFEWKDAPRNVPIVKLGKKPDPKQENQVSLIKSNSIIDAVSNEKIRISSLLQTTNSNCNSGRSPQLLEKKLVTSSSTVCVRKDAPGNVPVVNEGLGMKKPDPKEEKKVSLIKSNNIIDVVSNEKMRKSLLVQTTNSNSGRSPQCGIVDVSSSSTISYAQRNVPAVLEKEMGMKYADPVENKAILIKSGSSSIDHVVSNEKIRKLLSLQTTNSNSGRSPQWLEKKLVTSSSTLFVQKDAPRNVPVVKLGKKPDPKQEKKVSLIINEKWIKHYSNRHRILLVGEGDFSFSTSLALAFSSASNIIATSLNSQAFLLKNYQNALSNFRELSIRGCKVMYEIDATKMCIHPYLGGIKFDRIVFNFPFAGFFKDISRDSLLRRHRKLVNRFLMNAKKMISETGEIHITHKTSEFQMEWKVESMASSHGLRLVEAVDFNLLDYPGYNTKYGFGGDKNFNCYPSKTYKFGLRF